jgi:anaerobic selenocysteine-containing dehydrogenase
MPFPVQKERGISMKITRRKFLGGMGVAALSSSAACGKKLKQPEFNVPEVELKTKGALKTTTICPYCAVGCGMIVSQKNGNIVSIEGDPEHPVAALI